MHYVCSDIHGHYDYFMDILNKINFSDEDHMYINGDVVDRGPEPIKLLKYILEQKNMTLLIGNHEHFMIQSLMFNDKEQLSIWVNNGGERTLDQFDELSKSEQKDILLRLYNSPLAIPNLKIKNKNYYIAHASHSFRYLEKPILYSESSKEEIERIVWYRDYQNPDNKALAKEFKELYSKYKNTTLIIGHSPVYICSYRKITKKGRPMISRACSGHLINIDCGCSRGLPLACLRLEDLKEFYADIPDGMKIVMRAKRKWER